MTTCFIAEEDTFNLSVFQFCNLLLPLPNEQLPGRCKTIQRNILSTSTNATSWFTRDQLHSHFTFGKTLKITANYMEQGLQEFQTKTPALSRSRGGKILCASKKEAYICSCEWVVKYRPTERKCTDKGSLTTYSHHSGPFLEIFNNTVITITLFFNLIAKMTTKHRNHFPCY